VLKHIDLIVAEQLNIGEYIMRTYPKILAITLCLLIAPAGESQGPDPRRHIPEGSKLFRKGYVQGCRSGLHEYSPAIFWWQKSSKLYDNEEDYRRGWELAFTECYEREEKYPRMGQGAHHGGGG